MFFLLNARMNRLWKGLFSSSEKILDVGCGDDPKYHRFIPSRIVCVDKFPSKKADIIADAQSMPFKASDFDGLVSVNALYYCEAPRKAVAEFARVLKRKGRIVLITPFIYPIHDAPHDRYRFTEYGLRELLGKDFTIEKIVPIGGIFSIPLLLVYSLWKGSFSLAPKPMQPLIKILSTIVLLLPFIIAEIISIFDVLDRSQRWPIYYFTIARKK